MKKTAVIFVLTIMALLIISGCSTAQAQQNQDQNDYYVPDNNYGGCGVAGPEDTGAVFNAASIAGTSGTEAF